VTECGRERGVHGHPIPAALRGRDVSGRRGCRLSPIPRKHDETHFFFFSAVQDRQTMFWSGIRTRMLGEAQEVAVTCLRRLDIIRRRCAMLLTSSPLRIRCVQDRTYNNDCAKGCWIYAVQYGDCAIGSQIPPSSARCASCSERSRPHAPRTARLGNAGRETLF